MEMKDISINISRNLQDLNNKCKLNVSSFFQLFPLGLPYFEACLVNTTPTSSVRPAHFCLCSASSSLPPPSEPIVY